MTGTPPAAPAVYIVGFAPSWPLTPWDAPGAHYWGMNALHKVAGDKPWTAWFQLHDIERHHPNDRNEHLEWLANANIPVFMWAEHVEKYQLPNAVPYPREEIVNAFGPWPYFTNTVSWMTAFAIYQRYKKIGVYGVDMAQTEEHNSQRPSVEYFLGWASGAGIELDIPIISDLLKTPYLYGYNDDGGIFRTKLVARLEELNLRKAEMAQQRDQAQSVILQIMGAEEDVQYILRAWTEPNERLAPDGEHSSLPH